MRRHLRKLALVGVSLAALAGPALAGSCERPADAAIWEKALFNWVNSERKAQGLPAFRNSSTLKKAALFHACDMAAYGYFAHSRPDGPKLKERIQKAGYRIRTGAENIAYTRQPDPGTAAEIWRNSPPHWNSIINPDFTDAGVAIAEGGGKIYWVMDMGRSK